jgi:hypothetical protein
MNAKIRMLSIGTAALGIALAVPATAFACGGDKGKNKEARFQKADKNGDGFLTQTEVGDERWKKISVADANKDANVSKAELMQAHKDGKLGKRGKGKRA